MKSAHRFLVATYFILMIMIFAFYSCSARAEEDPTAAISIMDSGMNFEVIEITCHGETFSTNVLKIKLASSLKALEAYVDEKCPRGKK